MILFNEQYFFSISGSKSAFFANKFIFDPWLERKSYATRKHSNEKTHSLKIFNKITD